MAKKANISPKSAKFRVESENNLNEFISELDEVLTPIAAAADDDLLTGDWTLSTKGKITTVTLYVKEFGTTLQNKFLTVVYREIEEHILDVQFHGLDVYLEISKTSKDPQIDVIIFVPNPKAKDGMKKLKTLRYVLQPDPKAGPTSQLYHVTAQECLQCLACAIRQAQGGRLRWDTLKNYVNYFYLNRVNPQKHPLKNKRWNQLHQKIQGTYEFNTGSKSYVGTHADVCNFGAANFDWVKSSVFIANKLSSLTGGPFIFCHADASLVSWYWDGFTKARAHVLNNMSLFRGMSANELDRNKWNPADMFAISKTFNDPGGNWPGIDESKVSDQDLMSESELRNTLKSNGKQQGSVVDLTAQIDKKAKNYGTVSGIPSLNKYLYSLKGKVNPISLKKVSSTPTLDSLNVPNGNLKATATATLEEVNWANDYKGKATNKVEVHFTIKHGSSQGKKYYINARQFNENADIKFQIEKTGGMAFHGKAGLNIGKIIINKTDPSMKSHMQSVRSEVKKVANYKNVFNVGSNLFADKSSVLGTYREKSGPNSLAYYANLLSSKPGTGNTRGGPITQTPNNASGTLSKVQAAEFGYMMRDPTEKGATSHILYSLFMYAGSQGLVLFDGTSYKKYYSASWYYKAH